MKEARTTFATMVVCAALLLPASVPSFRAQESDESAPPGAPSPVTWTGIVLDERSGAAIPNALLRVGEATDPDAGQEVHTDEDGTFIIDALPGARLLVSHRGYHEGFVELTPGREAELGVLVLQPASALEGRIMNEEGPVAETPVHLIDLSNDYGDVVLTASTFTDARGAFRIDGVESDWYESFILSAPDASVRLPLSALPRRTLDLGDLGPGWRKTAEGRLLDERGEPVSGALVGLLPHGITPVWDSEFRDLVWHTTTTDDSGRFEILVSPGNYQLAAYAQGFLPTRRVGIEIDATEDVQELDTVVLSAGAGLRARVIDAAGGPLEGVTVTADLPSNWSGWWGHEPGRHLSARTGEDGCFELVGLPAGAEIRISFTLEGHMRVADILETGETAGTDEQEGSSAKTVGCGGTPPIVLPQAARIHLTVLDAAERPIPSAWAGARRLKRDRREYDPFLDGFTTAEGTLIISGLAPGDWYLVVVENGYQSETVQDIKAVAGETIEMRVVMTSIVSSVPTIDLEVQALDFDGRPASRAEIRLRSKSRWPDDSDYYDWGTTGADGRLTFAGVPYDDYSISISHPELGSWSVPLVEVDGMTGPVEARDWEARHVPALLAGRVVDERGLGIVGTRIGAQGDDSGGIGNITTSDGSGWFLFEQLAAGVYRLRAWKAGFAASVF
ncbi:MAG: carboxypeptidase regulatory-like domain-containing protein, partial [Deltaproteobacteria bacterium]|nr:carboxypeptidase regulatory-like domain-containing protein [Deltaproteobacteria bacterium]